MRNRIKIIGIVAIMAMTSCQKDYYLEDLQDAEAQIEQLQSIVKDLQTKLNDNEVSLADAQAEINSYVEQISKLDESLNDLTNLSEIQEAKIEIYKTQLGEMIDAIGVINNEMIALKGDRASLQAALNAATEENEDLKSQIANLTDRIFDLQEELANIEPEIVYITNTITQIVTEYVNVSSTDAEILANNFTVKSKSDVGVTDRVISGISDHDGIIYRFNGNTKYILYKSSNGHGYMVAKRNPGSYGGGTYKYKKITASPSWNTLTEALDKLQTELNITLN